MLLLPIPLAPQTPTPLNLTGRVCDIAASAAATIGEPFAANPSSISCRGLSVHYGGTQVITSLSLDVGYRQVLALIGMPGSGKSTLLRCLNRMADFEKSCRISGEVRVLGRDIEDFDPLRLRARIGMIGREPNPFPRSIYENVAYGPVIHGLTDNRVMLDGLVESALRRVHLWREVKNQLKTPALRLTKGQQQRLCIARALACNPEILLMDEPTSALDPLAAAIIEELIAELGQSRTIIVVPQSQRQAARISQRTAFLHEGQLIEVGGTRELFTNPRHALTQAYITHCEN